MAILEYFLLMASIYILDSLVVYGMDIGIYGGKFIRLQI